MRIDRKRQTFKPSQMPTIRLTPRRNGVVFVVHDTAENMIGVLQSDDIIGLRTVEFETVLFYVNNGPRLPIQYFWVSTPNGQFTVNEGHAY